MQWKTGSLVPEGEHKPISMSDEQPRQSMARASEDGGGWGVVFCWAGIYLLRLLVGLVAGAIVMVAFTGIGFPFSPDREFGWLLCLALLALVLTLTSIVFLPLWKEREKTKVRGQLSVVRAAKVLLGPAILFQLLATFRGEAGMGMASLVVVVGVCYLVTLSLDTDPRSQFMLLVIAAAQAVILCLVALKLGPTTPTDGWQITMTVWLGAIPPIALMVILHRQCRKVLLDGSREGVVAREGGDQ